MNILIVDDDRFVIASLKNGIDWETLGFDNIYTAGNIASAKTIISENTIDLLLSDIDMPNGNGLELLTWIRENHNDMPVIFLTNYADFDYAQKALHLKSFHYFLKPIEFEKLSAIIMDATLELTKQSNQLSKNCEIFWHSFLHNEISDHSDTLCQYFAQMRLPYSDKDYFLPILFDLSSYYLTDSGQLNCHFPNHAEQNNYMKNTFEAVFIEQITATDIFFEYNSNASRYLAVFKLDTETIPPLFLMNCERFIESVLTETGCNLNCFIGLSSQLGAFRTNLKKLRSMVQNSLDCTRSVLLLSHYHSLCEEYSPCDTEALRLYLENNQYTALLDYCSHYLKHLSASGTLSAVSLNSFQIDFVQTLYAYLLGKGILANKLFHDDTYHILSGNAKNSIDNMKLYLRYITMLTQHYLKEMDSDKSIAKSIQDYVDQHYSEDITRESLSDIFYLNTDYVSKLFKKETGLSFKNYVIQKRIAAAKNLLKNTDLPINTVSDNVGYGNYSYFTRIFKKETGMTPIEYRNQN